MRRQLAIAAALLLSAHGMAVAQTRSEVPIREVVLSDGTRRYGVPLKVGGTEIEAGLDSGSTGLRILPGALKTDDAAGNSDNDHYAYGAGTEFRGETGKGTLTFGDQSGVVTMQLIKTKDCVDSVPNCPASKIPMEQFGIQGNGIPGAGFKAIFGINMAEAEVQSPLPAVGTKRWIIELPRPGAAQAGKLILNPTDDETKDFVMIPILDSYRTQRGGLHDAISGCIINQTNKANACGALLLDTGAPGINVVNSGLGSTPWANNTAATLGFYDGHTPRAIENFTIGLREHASHLSFSHQEAQRDVVIYAGLSPYFAFDVLYDPQKRAIGLKPRPADNNSPTGGVSAN